MAYKLYMAGTLMPITPSKVTVKINNQNKTMTLINGEEINILKAAGLSDVSFELVLPQVSYPFSNGGAQSAAYYLSLFERLKVSKTPFQFILNRQKPGGGMFHYTNLTVGLETYEITDDAGEVLLLLVAELYAWSSKELHKTIDLVERCANLVRHIPDERLLHLIGFFDAGLFLTAYVLRPLAVFFRVYSEMLIESIVEVVGIPIAALRHNIVYRLVVLEHFEALL